MIGNKEPGPVKSLHRGLEIVEYIRRNHGATLRELEDDLDLARSTIHNHLSTLTTAGYLVREGNTYVISLLFLHLGEYARHRKPEFDIARKYVKKLSDQTGEEADFTVPEHGRMISIGHQIGDGEPVGMQTGSRFYMHNTAAGKAVLAELPSEKVTAIIDQWGLPGDTEYTITDEATLQRELEEIRNRGYAINDQELIEGFRSFGAVVRDQYNRILGALSVGGPTYRIEIDEASSPHIATLMDLIDAFKDDISTSAEADQNWWQKYRESPDII